MYIMFVYCCNCQVSIISPRRPLAYLMDQSHL
uniref:Uncharacterized protein n=1 Tax=Anguilla anguilla TaxID=7936 RepID=A0A0E9QLH2_ANGAN